LEKVLNNLLPLLQASEPDKLSVTLTALAQGLQGNGRELGQTLVALNAYLAKYNQHLPALDNDIKQLAPYARNLNQAAPDLVQALADFTVTSQTVVAERASVSALYSTLTTASGDLQSFLDANSANIIALNADSVGTLQILARYSPEFPCSLRDLVNFEPAVDKVLGKGTNQPGLHVQAGAVQARAVGAPPWGPHRAGGWGAAGTPQRPGDTGGPPCFSPPSRGTPPTAGPPPPTAPPFPGAPPATAGPPSGAHPPHTGQQ